MAYANAFMDMFGLSLPILQAPIGAAAPVALARAVGQAGGMGSLALTWTPAKQALRQLAELDAAKRPYFVNFVLRFGLGCLREVMAAKPPAIAFSWGMDAALVRDAQRHGVRVGIQIGSAGGAKAALAAGADFLIAQGIEAGGHVQSTTPLFAYLPQVVALAGQVPVIAAGGIASGHGIAAALAQGAQAVMLGTRYVATAESAAHPLYKQALVDAGAGGTAFTNCFDIDWPYAMHGVLRNETFEAWEAAGCPAAPNRPGEGDVVLQSAAGAFVRYCDTPPSDQDTGNIQAACLSAGAGVGEITAVEAAGPMTQRLWREALVAMASAGA